mmetsp:Transcript_1910/g.3631  ORF Transcript_1910/g.3631 Transcript_1910/m.3631 type:complete len:213 (-) Transcript_1910:348-986(-)
MVLRYPEDTGELLIVGRHESRLWWLLAELHNLMDVFHGAEAFVPLLQSRSHLQLVEADLQMNLDGLRSPLPTYAVDAGRLRSESLDIGELQAEHITQAAELQRALVVQTEGEGLLARLVVHLLQLRVLVQQLQHGSVGIPQKLKPGHHHLSVSAILDTLDGHGGEHDGLRGLGLVQIRHFGGGGQGHLIGLLASSSGARLGQVKQVHNDVFQ